MNRQLGEKLGQAQCFNSNLILGKIVEQDRGQHPQTGGLLRNMSTVSTHVERCSLELIVLLLY